MGVLRCGYSVPCGIVELPAETKAGLCISDVPLAHSILPSLSFFISSFSLMPKGAQNGEGHVSLLGHLQHICHEFMLPLLLFI